MSVLVTGAAGFIGFHTIQKLLSQDEHVIGIDSLNDYYDVSLKKRRLALLQQHPHFHFEQVDISCPEDVTQLSQKYPHIDRIVHLAAQAGVRYSLTHPFAYVDANLTGHLSMLEFARHHPNGIRHMVYASSSSVYGSNTKMPFSVEDRTDTPIALYAATKKANELMSHSYAHLFKIPLTGLRFFTVYGPWGRPDMSAFSFTKAILAGEEIPVFNQGDMRRNYTYVADIVDGTLRCLERPSTEAAPHRVYNIGNNRSESLMDFIETLEKHIGKKAKIRFEPMQPGDVKETIADIEATTRDVGFIPQTHIDEGLKNFVEWYRAFYG